LLSGRAMGLGKETGMRKTHGGGRGRVELAPMPLDEEGRIRAAVDGWSELSEMPDELAWLIGCVMATGDSENGFDSGVSTFWPATGEANGGVPMPAAEDDWFMELAKKDRLLAWKMAAYGRAVDDGLLAAVSGELEEMALSKRAQREILEWKAVDEIPGWVAGAIGEALADACDRDGQALMRAVRRQAPELTGAALAARAGLSGLGPWLSRVAADEPVRGIKLGLEAVLRSVETLSASGEGGAGVVMAPAYSWGAC
jgi:hypothetical protein